MDINVSAECEDKCMIRRYLASITSDPGLNQADIAIVAFNIGKLSQQPTI